MYSRLMEDYLTMCAPELGVTVRQFGWSGERAPGFLHRMTNDCLRFQPTLATTCYGMNDHEYRAYEPRIGDTYRLKLARHRERVQGRGRARGARFGWLRRQSARLGEDSFVHGGRLESESLQLAQHRGRNRAAGKNRFRRRVLADDDHRCGRPAALRHGFPHRRQRRRASRWAGHAIMAYAFLKSFGLDGDIGVLTVD